MGSQIFIPLAIVLVSASFCVGVVAWVLVGIMRRSRTAHEDIERLFPTLFESGFRWEKGPAALFSPVLRRYGNKGGVVKLHFRIPGRGYVGTLPYDGVQLSLVQFVGGGQVRRLRLHEHLAESQGEIIYESSTRLQWKPRQGFAWLAATQWDTLFD